MFSRVSEAFFCLLIVTVAAGLGKVRLYVPMAVKEGDTAVLRCLFDLGGDALYSVKWYKGGREIFRYIPRETPSIKIFPIPYLIDLNIEKSKSNATHLVLRKVTTNLSGRYSCEVSADAPSFRTALVTGDMKIVVIPTTLPRVEGMKPRYRVGDTLVATCISRNSKPAANLTWGLNGNLLDSEYIKKFHVKVEPESNLETAISTLSLELQRHHFSSSGRLKLKCTASIHNIYWRTSENSAEEERPKAAVVAAQDYRLHDVFRKPIDVSYSTVAPSSSASSFRNQILPFYKIHNNLINNIINIMILIVISYSNLY